ncbi:MAG: hypothetical protein NDI94_04640 [Candidatus Woesearchaeota archaeon]|nr:hypothetical protein [Candidatus Woesearchaeota archaeon]
MIRISDLQFLSGHNYGINLSPDSGAEFIPALDKVLMTVPRAEFGLSNIASAIQAALKTNYWPAQHELITAGGLEKLHEEAPRDYLKFRGMDISPIWSMALTHVAARIRNEITTSDTFKYYVDHLSGDSIKPVEFLNILEPERHPGIPRLINDSFAFLLYHHSVKYNTVIGIEARGFNLAGGLAVTEDKGYIAVRKAGKIPDAVFQVRYIPEYPPEQTLEAQLIESGDVLGVLCDDILATGLTSGAGRRAVGFFEGQVAFNVGPDRMRPSGSWYVSASQKRYAAQRAAELQIPTGARIAAIMHAIEIMYLGGRKTITKDYAGSPPPILSIVDHYGV